MVGATGLSGEWGPAISPGVKLKRQSLLTKEFAPIDIGGYFPAASNSFTFPITAKASAT
jgi:hypothetical protein